MVIPITQDETRFVSYICELFDDSCNPGHPVKEGGELDTTLLERPEGFLESDVTLSTETDTFTWVRHVQWIRRDSNNDRKTFIESSIQEKLVSVGQEYAPRRFWSNSSAEEQLLHTIFTQAYVHATEVQKKRIIELAAPGKEILESSYTPLQRTISEIQKVAAPILHNRIFQGVISLLTVTLVHEVARVVLLNYVFPMSYVYFLRYSSEFVLQSFNLVWGFMSFHLTHYWNISVNTLMLRAFFKRFENPIAVAATTALDALTYPISLYTYIKDLYPEFLIKGLSFSVITWKCITDCLQSDNTNVGYYADEGRKAHDVWMHLLTASA